MRTFLDIRLVSIYLTLHLHGHRNFKYSGDVKPNTNFKAKIKAHWR